MRRNISISFQKISEGAGYKTYTTFRTDMDIRV
jgi:hypothetical protein